MRRIGNLPTTINGNKINSDFRISIQFEQLLLDKSINSLDKTVKALELYYPNIDKIMNIEQAIEDMIYFYQCGKEKKELANSDKEKDKKEENQIYNYEFDWNYIATSFLEQYRIDLWDIKYLHWWKFKALLEGLSDNTKFSKIMEYRALDLAKIKDKELKKFYKSMRKVYGLPDTRSQEEKEADFASAFW